MRFWLICLGVLFVGAESYQWLLAQLGNPAIHGTWLWIGIGGAALAIASNHRYVSTWLSSTKSASQSLTSNPNIESHTSSPEIPSPQQPLKDEKGSPVSFKIRKTQHPFS